MKQTTIHRAALAYRRDGISILPTNTDKTPALPSWKVYEKRPMTEKEVNRWFAKKAAALAIICGKVSGNAEVLDFDHAGALTFPFGKRLIDERPKLFARLVAEKTPSGGDHIAYRCEEPVEGNRKLAQRGIRVPGPGNYEYMGKKLTARKFGNHWYVVATLIETRGEGGYFLCYPSPGYHIFMGRFSRLPVISKSDRDYLLQVARDLNEWTPPKVEKPAGKPVSLPKPGRAEGSVIEAFNAQVSPMTLLEQAGWIRAGGEGTAKNGGHSVRMRRPGKDRGHSGAVIDNSKFVCFSESALPFEATSQDNPIGYDSFGIYSLLNHGGDCKAAARDLWGRGYK